MRLRALLLALLACCVLVAAAAAAGPPPGPPPTPQQQAALDACKGQGLKPPGDAFNQCIAQHLGGPKPPPGGPPQGGPPQGGPPPGPTAAFSSCQAQGLKVGSDAFNACVKAFDQAAAQKPNGKAPPGMQAAVAACKAKGVAENTTAFQDCLKDETSTGPTPHASDQAAIDGCKASGIPQRTDAFRACVLAASAAASISGWTGEQVAAYNVCKSARNPFPSTAFAACLSKVLTKLIPDQPKAAQKEVAGVLADCQQQKLVGAAFQKCVRDRLGG
jgi:hypothetical protein